MMIKNTGLCPLSNERNLPLTSAVPSPSGFIRDVASNNNVNILSVLEVNRIETSS